MNLLLLDSDDFIHDDQAVLSHRCANHLLDVQKVCPGDRIKVGQVNGRMGWAIVTSVDQGRVELSDIVLDQAPPIPLPVTLILALPRPKMLRRIFQTAATMGVKDIVLINAVRVEKSYWQSPFLRPEKIREQFILGLEQGKDTVLPKIHMAKLFKPYVEDVLSLRDRQHTSLVAHPYQSSACPRDLSLTAPCFLAVGPEGGFVEYEVNKLAEIGFQPVSLGERILRVETAIPVLLAKLFNH